MCYSGSQLGEEGGADLALYPHPPSKGHLVMLRYLWLSQLRGLLASSG